MRDSVDTILIGVDGGGTGCRVAIGTCDTGVSVEVSGGRANVATDFDLAIRNIKAAVTAAATKAGFDLGGSTTTIAHVGLAGVLTPADALKVANALPYTHCVVTDDRPTAVTGALDGQDGFVVSIGTGTIIGASTDGAFRYVGCWGFHLADQASGAWLGRVALNRVLQCFDRVMDHSPLTREILAQFDGDPTKISTFSFTAVPGDYGAFAPAIMDAAQAGDPHACAILREGVDYIARALTSLGFEFGDPLCLTGGVGPHYDKFLSKTMTSQIVVPKHTAVYGAFQLAGRAARDVHKVHT